MHCVLPPVGGSLASEDPYQELVLFHRVKNVNSMKKLCPKKNYQNTLVVGPASLSSTHQAAK